MHLKRDSIAEDSGGRLDSFHNNQSSDEAQEGTYYVWILMRLMPSISELRESRH